MTGWNYRGANVQVPRTADIPFTYQPGRRNARHVQQALDQVEPWKEGSDPIVTIELEDSFLKPIVVPIVGRVYWGIHSGHHAKRPEPSPFVMLSDLQYAGLSTDLISLELTQSVHRPKLVRVYPGSYVPPLPWMVSANDAPGGRRACIDFWRHHAYVHRKLLVARRSTQVPDWFRR